MAQAKCVLWLTRAPGSAEAALARSVESELRARGYGVEALDAADAGAVWEADGARPEVDLEGLLAREGVVVIDARTSPAPAVREGLSRHARPLIEVSVRGGEGESEEVVRRVVAELESAGGDAAPAQDGYNAEEEEEIRRRLEDLGYL